MKSKDLKIDGSTEYYYTTSETYLKWAHQADRAVVVDATAGHWRLAKDRQTLVDTWMRTPGGQQVLVDLYPARGRTDPDGNPYEPRRMAVRSQCLRGEWETALQDIALHRQMKQAYQQEQQARQATAEQPCNELVSALLELGVAATTDYNRQRLVVEIPAADTALLTQAVRHLIDTGWKPAA